MIGIVVISHGDLAKSLINTAEFIIGVQNGIIDVAIDVSDSFDKIKKKIEVAIQQTDTGDGILVLTDMLGGTPSIASLSFISKYRIEVVSGVNLPMILEVILHREKSNLSVLAKIAVSKTKKSIVLASFKSKNKR